MREPKHMSLSIGGFSIQVTLLPCDNAGRNSYFHSLLQSYFKGFVLDTRTQTPADAYVYVADSPGVPLIECGKSTYSKSFFKKNKNSYETYYHVSPYQFSQLLQIILISLLGSDGFLLHASAVQTPRGVVAFAGISGSGKSTTLQMVREAFHAIADDSIIIRYLNNSYRVYQSPHLDLKHMTLTQGYSSFPLCSIVFVRKWPHFNVAPLTTTDAFKRLISSVWHVSKLKPIHIRAVSRFLTYNSQNCLLLKRDISHAKSLIDYLSCLH